MQYTLAESRLGRDWGKHVMGPENVAEVVLTNHPVLLLSLTIKKRKRARWAFGVTVYSRFLFWYSYDKIKEGSQANTLDVKPKSTFA